MWLISEVDNGGANGGGLWRRWGCRLGGNILDFAGLEVWVWPLNVVDAVGFLFLGKFVYKNFVVGYKLLSIEFDYYYYYYYFTYN